LAERQWGVVSHNQLVELGAGRTGIARWIDDGRLHRVHPGVYAVGHPGLGLEGKMAAALFYAGPGAALSHVTAGWWLGVLKTTPRRLHVCAPSRRRSLNDVRVHARRTHDRIRHKRLPVTPPPQTLLDIAGMLRFTDLRRALAEAEYLRLVTLEEVAEVLGRGKPGSAALRLAIECHRPELARAKSLMEERFVLLCERYCLIPPAINVWIGRWQVDAVWFEHKVAVELDSRLAHDIPSRLEEDHQRDLELRAVGYVVLRYT
jgi:predicted transcriptional regulator of viral defense system